MMKKTARSLLVFTAICASCLTGQAATSTWTGGSGGTNLAWVTSGNWSPSGVPAEGNDVLIATANMGNYVGGGSATSGNMTLSNTSGTGTYTINTLTFGGASAETTRLPTLLTIYNSSSGEANSRLTINTGITLTSSVTGTVALRADNSGSGGGMLTFVLGGTGLKEFNVAASATLHTPSSTFVISSTNTAGILKTGAGVFVTGAANTFTGGLTLAEGTLRTQGVGVANVSSPFGTGTLTLQGGTLTATGATSRSYWNSVILDGGNITFGDAVGTASQTFSATASSVTTMTASTTMTVNAPVEWRQAISGTGNITKAGPGTLTLSSNNTFEGGVILSSGTIATLGSTDVVSGTIANGALGKSTLTLAGGALTSSSSTVRSYANSVVIAGNTTLGDATNNGTQTFSGSAGGTTTLSGNHTLTLNSDVAWQQAISGTGFRLTKDGAGTLTLGRLGASVTNTFDGLTINGGKVAIFNTQALGTAPSSYQADSIVLNSGTLQFNYTATTTQVSANRGVSLGSGGGTIEVTSGDTIALGGRMVELAPGSSFTKTGAGALWLTGSSSYTGPTVVSGGTLIVGVGGSGSLGNTEVTVNSGAVLGGSGSIGGNVTVLNGGTLAPGNSPGLLTLLGDLTLSSSSAITMEIAGTTRGSGYDALNIGGLLTLDGTVSVTSGYAFAEGNSFELFNWGSIDSSGFNVASDLLLPDLSEGLLWDTSSFLSNGVISITAVPEPSAYGLTILGSAMVVIWLVVRRNRVVREESPPSSIL